MLLHFPTVHWSSNFQRNIKTFFLFLMTNASWICSHVTAHMQTYIHAQRQHWVLKWNTVLQSNFTARLLFWPLTQKWQDVAQWSERHWQPFWHCRVVSMKLYYIYNSVTAFDLTGCCNNIMYFRWLLCYWVGMSIFERKSGQYYVSVEKNCTKCQMLQLYHKMLKKGPVALKNKIIL